MSIPLTQFLLPDGRQRAVTVDSDEATETAAQALLDTGARFECELLTTGEVHMDCQDSDDELLAIEVVPNGPEVPLAVKRLVETATTRIKEQADA